MSNQTILYFMAGTVALFLIVVIAYVILRKKMGKSEMRKMKELQEGTKEKKFSSDVTYQKLYLIYNNSYLIFLKNRENFLNVFYNNGIVF